jgi:hypothetical protein
MKENKTFHQHKKCTNLRISCFAFAKVEGKLILMVFEQLHHAFTFGSVSYRMCDKYAEDIDKLIRCATLPGFQFIFKNVAVVCSILVLIKALSKFIIINKGALKVYTH